MDLAPARQSAGRAREHVRRRQSARLRPPAARSQLRSLPGRRRLVRPAPERVGRAAVGLGQGRGRSARDSDRARELRQHRRVLESGRAGRDGQRIPLRVSPVLGLEDAGRRRRSRTPPRRGPASAARSAASASISRGASSSTSPAASSRSLPARREGRTGRSRSRAARPSSCPRVRSTSIKGWRAMFDVRPPDASDEPIDMRLFLRSGEQALTETGFISGRRRPKQPALSSSVSDLPLSSGRCSRLAPDGALSRESGRDAAAARGDATMTSPARVARPSPPNPPLEGEG